MQRSLVAGSVALVLYGALAAPAAAAPDGFTVVRLKTPKISLAYPKDWLVVHGLPARVRADRQRLAAEHPEQLAAFDAEVAKQRAKGVALVAGPTARFGHLRPRQARSLRAAGWKPTKVDGRPGFRLERTFTSDEGTQTAHATAVMTTSRGQVFTVAVSNAGTTAGPDDAKVIKSVHLRDR